MYLPITNKLFLPIHEIMDVSSIISWISNSDVVLEVSKVAKKIKGPFFSCLDPQVFHLSFDNILFFIISSPFMSLIFNPKSPEGEFRKITFVY